MTPQSPENLKSPGSERTVRMFGPLGSPIAGDIYHPDPDLAKVWSIVICPGYGSIKELMENWGEALAERGFQVLVVGYRGYGDQPGEVGRIFPEEHVQDARTAIRWLRAQTSPGRIAVLGVSYGGAVGLQAAVEEHADAVISIVGYGSGSRHLRALRRHREWLGLLDRVQEDRAKRVTTGESAVISLNEILLRDDEAQEWRERVEREFPGMRFDVTIESVDRLLEFEPEWHLSRAERMPLLAIHAEKDSIIPMEEVDSFMARANEPKRLVVLEDAEHHAVHSGEHFESCLNEIESFLSDIPTAPHR